MIYFAAQGRGHDIQAAVSPERHCFLLLGFAKGDRSNIDDRELRALRMLASDLLGLSDGSLERLITSGVLTELEHEAKTEGTGHDPGRRPRNRR